MIRGLYRELGQCVERYRDVLVSCRLSSCCRSLAVIFSPRLHAAAVNKCFQLVCVGCFLMSFVIPKCLDEVPHRFPSTRYTHRLQICFFMQRSKYVKKNRLRRSVTLSVADPLDDFMWLRGKKEQKIANAAKADIAGDDTKSTYTCGCKKGGCYVAK